MKRSFKLLLFINIIVSTTVIILSNRFISQYLVNQQIDRRVYSDMQKALSNCAASIEDKERFLNCFKQTNAVNVASNISAKYILCNASIATDPPPSNPLCAALQKPEELKGLSIVKDDGLTQISRFTIDGTGWHAASLKNDVSPHILLKDDEVVQFFHWIWQLRDDNLIFVLPIIMSMLVLLTWHMVRVTMTAIQSLQASLIHLSSSNLDKPAVITTQFKEFDPFVTVYEDLCARLSTSFTKARRFSADASHELRTPLAILRGNAEQFIAELPVGSDHQIRMRKMADEIERLIDISEKLLLLSKADADLLHRKMVDFNVSKFLNRLTQDSLTYQKNMAIKKTIAPDIVWQCDQGLIQQLIHNLYSNAVKYNIANGWIDFKLTQKLNWLELTIENPTPHIPHDLCDKAFDRFYRGDMSRNRNIDGMGLGLSICLEVAKLHHGTLTLETTPSHTVRVRLSAPLKPLLLAH